jgi:hypothetical protein
MLSGVLPLTPLANECEPPDHLCDRILKQVALDFRPFSHRIQSCLKCIKLGLQAFKLS